MALLLETLIVLILLAILSVLLKIKDFVRLILFKVAQATQPTDALPLAVPLRARQRLRF